MFLTPSQRGKKSAGLGGLRLFHRGAATVVAPPHELFVERHSLSAQRTLGGVIGGKIPADQAENRASIEVDRRPAPEAADADDLGAEVLGSTSLIRRFSVDPVETRSSMRSTFVRSRISRSNSTGRETRRLPFVEPLAPYTTMGREGCARATQCDRISAPGPVESTRSTGHGAKCFAITAPRPSVNDGSVVTSVFSMYSLVCCPEGKSTWSLA
jgi:hypothetical protein